jgi:hypothetical protein
MFPVILIVLIGVFMSDTRSDTGILYQLGDDWYIDSNYRHNHRYFYSYLGIKNPYSFPHVLIPENNGTEVHYCSINYVPVLAVLGPHFVYVFTLDLVPVFIIKQSILCICIAISSIVIFTYLNLNRKRFPITNKLF